MSRVGLITGCCAGQRVAGVEESGSFNYQLFRDDPCRSVGRCSIVIEWPAAVGLPIGLLLSTSKFIIGIVEE